LLAEGKRAALMIRGSAAADRFVSQRLPEKMHYLRALKGKENEAERDAFRRQCESDFNVVLDNRTDQIAEFLAFLWRRVLGEVFPDLEKKLGMQDIGDLATRKRKLPKGYHTAKEMLKWLGISDIVSPEEAAFQKGMRIPTGWYCTAAVYLKKHPELDPDGIESLFADLSKHLLACISSSDVHPRQEAKCEDAFTRYVVRTLEIDGKPVGHDDQESFGAELANYVELKAKNKLTCSLCSSPFPASEQVDSVVLFKGQQYSNKGQLGGGQVKRGICPICALEMVFRQIQQEMPAKSAEDDRSIYLYLYPTYFFTPETAQVIRFFLNDLDDLDMSPHSEDSLISYLRKNGFHVASVQQYGRFLVEPGMEPLSLKRSLVQAPRYSEKDAAGLFLFSLKPKKSSGRNLTDTDAWILPTFYGLALPLLLNVKAVVTPSFVPVYGTGADFRETAILDAPHGFTRHILGRDRFRVDETGDYLIRLLELYDLHLDVFAERNDLHWPQLNAVAKDIATDPLYVFAYYDRKARGEKKPGKGKKGGNGQTDRQGIPPWDINRYIEIYQTSGGETNMGFVGEIVDAYAQFYQAEYGKLNAAYAVLRPLMAAIDVTVDSDPQTSHDDLVLLVAGTINDDQERVRGGQADGFDPITRNKELGTYPERITLSRQKIEDFARLFLDKVFAGYCHSDRAILRERTNRIRSAARFYYLQHYSRKAN
jgi:CRISPR-associated protein Csc3